VIPADKFGKPIYPKLFGKLLGYGDILLSKGYKESIAKPNLFLKRAEKLIFFMDMRGTKEVPIWDNPLPLFYYSTVTDIPNWMIRKYCRDELIMVFNAGCPFRYSYDYDCDYYPNIFVEENEKGIYELLNYSTNDGYCYVCKKELDHGDLCCSPECLNIYEESLKVKCPLCSSKFPSEHIVRHHITYKPINVIDICRVCHFKIHNTDIYLHLRPEKAEVDKYYGR